MIRSIRRFGPGAFGLGVSIVAVLCALVAFGQANETIPLYEAIRDGKVIATFRGTGGSSGDVVTAEVAKTTKAGPGILTLTVPPGSMLRSANAEAQSMVLMSVRGRDTGGGTFSPASRIVVSSTKPVTYILSAFCAEFEKHNPSTADTFSLEAANPALACLARQAGTLSVEAMQAAVWIRTDQMTYERITKKFQLSQADWSAAEVAFRRCGASASEPGRSSASRPVGRDSPGSAAKFDWNERVLDAGTLGVTALSISPDGFLRALSGTSITLWDLATGSKIRTLELPWTPEALSQDWRVAFGFASKLLEVTSSREIGSVDSKFSVSAAFSPDGRKLALGKLGEIILFDASTGLELRPLHKEGEWLHDNPNYVRGVIFVTVQAVRDVSAGATRRPDADGDSESPR